MNEPRPQTVKEKEKFSSHGRTGFLILRGKWGLAVDKLLLWISGYSLITAQYAWAAGDTYQQTLMLYTTGAKSGKKRIASLPYFDVDGKFVVRGSNGGGPTDPHWVHNIRANGAIKVRAARKTSTMRAHVATGDERAELYQKLCRMSRSTAYYQKMCAPRELPLVVLVQKPGTDPN
jgi:deazaflavin-dependent oxidoreductase (nitroreductase family)